jgi:hypothetical protein
MRWQECSTCGEEIDTADHDENYEVECSCGKRFRVDPDAEFDDGMWRDRTKIFPIPWKKSGVDLTRTGFGWELKQNFSAGVKNRVESQWIRV